MRVEGNVVITTEEQARKKAPGKNKDDGEDYEIGNCNFNNKGKSKIFTKKDDVNTNIMKSKL